MSAKDSRGIRANRSAEAAAQLKRRGILHGMRQTSSNADPMSYLNPKLVGSAKYQRLTNQKR
jgi:hypothetical protein